MELSYATNSLGSLAMKRQQFDLARKNFEESLRLKLLAQQQQPDSVQLIADIADTRSWLASAVLAQGDLSSAIAIHEQLQLQLEGMKATSEPYLFDILTSSYQLLADLLEYQGRTVEAQSKAKLGFTAISKALAQDPDNSTWKRIKHYYFFKNFKFQTGLNSYQIERDLALSQAALDADRSAITEVNSKEIEIRLWRTAAQQLQNLGLFSNSKTYADLAFHASEQLTAQYSNNMSYIAFLTDSQLLQAKVLVAESQYEAATSLCEQIQRRLADVVQTNKDARYVSSYAKALDCLGLLASQPQLIKLLEHNSIVNYHF